MPINRLIARATPARGNAGIQTSAIFGPLIN
jgi:hypothetical protein